MKMKIISLILLVSALLMGCSHGNSREDAKREAFRVPEYGNISQKPELDRVGDMLRAGSRHYHLAVAQTDPLEKKRLFRIAAGYYEKALEELKALQAQSTSAREKEDLGLVMKSVQEDLFDCYRQTPVTGE